MIVLEFVKFLIFPGLLFGIWMSFTAMWMIRKFTARIENRVGPPFNQPIYDFAKLVAKERVYPKNSVVWIMHYLPRFQAVVAMIMIFFIPIVSNEGLFSFDGDIYFFLFLLTLHGSTAFLIGWASRNPYTLSGAGRAIFTEISLEIPFAISLGGIAIMTGSLRISEITANLWNSVFFSDSIVNVLLIIPWILLFVSALYASIGALEITPFSAPHAETEIVSGWNTELTGSDFAIAKLADFINLFNLSGILVAFFFGGPIIMLTEMPVVSYIIAFVTFIVKFIIVILLLSFIITLSSRLRIDQIVKVLWDYFLPTAMFAILLVLLIKQGGTML